MNQGAPPAVAAASVDGQHGYVIAAPTDQADVTTHRLAPATVASFALDNLLSATEQRRVEEVVTVREPIDARMAG